MLQVLAVDASRKRILLTAKKTLVESELPIISSFETAKVDTVTCGVISKVMDKALIVEFYNNVRGIIPAAEASETPVASLSESFSVGKPIKVRITSVDPSSSRIVASIRKLSSNVETTGSIDGIEVGQAVSGTVSDIAGESVRLLLQPSNARALMSLKNVANNRGSTVDQLRTTLKKGDVMGDLLVVSRNVEKRLVIVANRPAHKSSAGSHLAHLDVKTVIVGSKISGTVTKHTSKGAVVKFPGVGSRMTGLLHITDVSDNYDEVSCLPGVNSVVTAVVIAVDKERRQFILSSRASRVDTNSSSSTVEDTEIKDSKELEFNKEVRGFIKSIADHGVFVTLGRDLDARVQIKELYDEVSRG